MCKMLNMHKKKMKILLISPEIKLFIFKRLYDYIILFQFFTFTEYFSGLSTKIFDITLLDHLAFSQLCNLIIKITCISHVIVKPEIKI